MERRLAKPRNYFTKGKLNYHKEHYAELLSHLIEDDDIVANMDEANLKQMDAFL